MGRKTTVRKPGDLPYAVTNTEPSGKKAQDYMALKKSFYLFMLLLCPYLWAQQDTITRLKEVIISDTQLQDFSDTQSVLHLNDSVIVRNGSSLTDVLRYNTVVYFKENGLGMVSSPSFRGTTAQQTAVVWNGINVNSQLNGLTDFNTINTRDFSSIAVRAGGGSVIYGSSAIGGSIHLNNNISFSDTIANSLYTNYGSYNTYGVNYNAKASTKKTSVDFSITHNSSDNDYEYPNTNARNENGQYYNLSTNLALGFKLNENNILRLYNYIYDSERHFSGTVSAPSLSKYRDRNSRSMAEWLGTYGRFTSKLKAALLTEHYKYYARITNPNYTFGKVNTLIGRYDIAYQAAKNIKLNVIADVTHNDGNGSDIEEAARTVTSFSFLMQHDVTTRLYYEAGLRREITNAYDSPVLFSAGAGYRVADFYSVKLNASRNFRIPTFNDLYWVGSGNPDLKPESSYQAEIGNEFTFNTIKLFLTGYYIKLRDMLRWIPVNNVWRPENVGKVNTYGAEAIAGWQRSFGNSNLTADATYAYTVSREDGSSNQLIYVPLHKITASVAYGYKNASVYYRHLYNGSVFTTSDNSDEVEAYNVATLGAEYTIGICGGLTAGVQAHNLFDAAYENVTKRPMPGRNYTMYLNFKF